jgi:Arc/MetJ family transcription regulator
MHMRTTLILDDTLVAEAMRQTGVKEKTTVVRLGLEALIQRESARRLAALGGSMPGLDVSPRRRSTKRR